MVSALQTMKYRSDGTRMSPIWTHECPLTGAAWHMDLSRVICITTRPAVGDEEFNPDFRGTSVRVTWVDGKETQGLIFGPDDPVEPMLDAWRQIREACI